jgi:hypothetical protein
VKTTDQDDGWTIYDVRSWVGWTSLDVDDGGMTGRVTSTAVEVA